MWYNQGLDYDCPALNTNYIPPTKALDTRKGLNQKVNDLPLSHRLPWSSNSCTLETLDQTMDLCFTTYIIYYISSPESLEGPNTLFLEVR